MTRKDSLADSNAQAPDALDRALRPQTFEDYVGQRKAKSNLKVYVDAARGRAEALDHVLLFGPPGLGKTTLAQILAREMGVGFRATSGPVIAKPGDLAAIRDDVKGIPSNREIEDARIFGPAGTQGGPTRASVLRKVNGLAIEGSGIDVIAAGGKAVNILVWPSPANLRPTRSTVHGT